MEGVRRVDILGCPFDAVSFDETLQAVRDAVTSGRRLQIVPGNVDFVMKARRDPVFAGELRRAELVVADGQFIAWAARLLGTPIRGRVSGTDLVVRCAEISASLGCDVALVGGLPGVAERAAGKMTEAYPGARLHPLPTPSPLDEAANASILERIRALRARIVLVALGAPRQERWVQANLERCGASVGIGVGSAFDLVSGDVPRAPYWMQRLSLEWLFRMILEPGRLGRRYLIEDSPFVFHLAHQAVRRAFVRESAR